MYSRFKDVLIIDSEGTKFSIPFYSQNKSVSQSLNFNIIGSLVGYSFTLRRYVYADRRFLPAGKGDFTCASNKRKSVDGQKTNVAYSVYKFNNLQAGENYKEITVKFVFTDNLTMQFLDSLIKDSAGKALISSEFFIRKDCNSNWEAIELPQINVSYDALIKNRITA